MSEQLGARTLRKNPRLWLLIPGPTRMITLHCWRNLGLGEQDPLYTPTCLIPSGLLASLTLRKRDGTCQLVLSKKQKQEGSRNGSEEKHP